MSKTSLITLTDPRSSAAEAFRTLRTNLLFSGVERPLSTLLITSPAPENEAGPIPGKSLMLANLAVTLAQSGRTVVIVDCDLRRPAQHLIFGLPEAPGLTNALTDGQAALPLTPTSVDNLRVLPAGPLPPIPADVIGSRQMEALIERLKTQAEWVLFDAPPVLAVTDAALLAAKTDGVLLVISAGRTTRDHAQRAKELLDKTKARLLGSVLTNARIDASVKAY